MKLALILTSFTIFTSGLIYIYFKHGILSSISKFYYVAEKSWYFRAFTWLSALPLLVVGTIEQNEIFILAVTSWLFVGFAADIRGKDDKITKTVHVVGASGCILLGYIYMKTDLGLWWLVAPSLLATIIMWKYQMKNHTWWIEALAYYTIIAGLLIRLN